VFGYEISLIQRLEFGRDVQSLRGRYPERVRPCRDDERVTILYISAALAARTAKTTYDIWQSVSYNLRHGHPCEREVSEHKAECGRAHLGADSVEERGEGGL
jgi:hypothetical protein